MLYQFPISWFIKLLLLSILILTLGAFSLKILNLLTHRVRGESERLEAKIKSISEELRSSNRELKRRVYELHNLFQISIDLTAIRDTDRLINSFLNTLLGQLSTKNAVLLLNQSSEEEDFEPRGFKGLTEGEVKGLRFRRGDPLLEILQRKRKPLVVTNKLPAEDISKLRRINSKVCAPLIYSDRLEGVISIGPKINGEPYTRAEMEMLTLLANMVSVAIMNAQFYQKLERISITDGLTGLYNFRYFEKRLRDEVARARRNNRFVSLVILDVDHFKNYNDTLGHPAGDRVLKQLAKILKRSIRETDIAARYGGEEFCVILPEVGEKGALSFGERLRKKVEEFPFDREDIQPGGKLTISLGSASFPTDAKMVRELIIKADAALYQAKNMGRNVMCLYSQKHYNLEEMRC